MKCSGYTRFAGILLLASMASGPFAGRALAQFVNPIQAAKDAYNKAKAQQQAQKPATQPAPAPAASQPASHQATPTSQPVASNQLAVNGAFSSSLLTPVPAGGLDPSKLPDLLGIHIGEPTAQAVAEIRKLYPVVRNDKGTLLSGLPTVPMNHYPFPNAPQYVSAVAVVKPTVPHPAAGCYGCSGEDRIDAVFSGPPDERLAQLKRSVTWDLGKAPVSDALKSALVEKYGPNFVEGPAMTYTWLFDETGKPMPPLPRNIAMTGCQTIVTNQNGVAGMPSSGMPSYLGVPMKTVPQQQLDRIVNVRCGMQIQVVAWINGTPGGAANALIVTINEIAADLRAGFAAENYIRQSVNAQGDQQLKNAQQQTTPTF